MLKKAKAGHYAVGHFNINNLEWTKAILASSCFDLTRIPFNICFVILLKKHSIRLSQDACFGVNTNTSVSYTHLDVYKRQVS